MKALAAKMKIVRAVLYRQRRHKEEQGDSQSEISLNVVACCSCLKVCYYVNRKKYLPPNTSKQRQNTQRKHNETQCQTSPPADAVHNEKGYEKPYNEEEKATGSMSSSTDAVVISAIVVTIIFK